MTAFTASHTSDTVMVTGCSNTPIAPSTASEWGCPHNNQVQWKDLTTPETLQPGEAKSFLVRVRPGNLNINEEPGATVIATVYTDIGIFTKTGYTTSMRDGSTSLGNVYLTDTTDTSTSGALSNSHMFGHKNDIPPDTNTTFYVAMADLDQRDTTRINSGGKLIIDVPPGFSNVKIVSSNLFSTPTVTVRADGITQIIAVTTGHTGDDDFGEAKVIAFAAVTPSPKEDTTYIMYAFIDGLTNGSPQVSAGALAEIALQVNGTG
jgi:hypothetical protein